MAVNLSGVVLSVAAGSLVNSDPFVPFFSKKSLPDPPPPFRYDIAVYGMILQKKP